jgi:hypothetical protein
MSSSQDSSCSLESKSSVDQLFTDYVCGDVLDSEKDTTAQALDIFDEYSSSSSEIISLDTPFSITSTSFSSFKGISYEDLHPHWKPTRPRVKDNDASTVMPREDNPYSIYRSIPTTPAISNSDVLHLEGRSTCRRLFAPRTSVSSSGPRTISTLQNDFQHNASRMPRSTLERNGRISKPPDLSRRHRPHPDDIYSRFNQSKLQEVQLLDVATYEYPGDQLPLSPPDSANHFTEEESISSFSGGQYLPSSSFSSVESSSSYQSSTASSGSQDSSSLYPVINCTRQLGLHSRRLSAGQGLCIFVDHPTELVSSPFLPASVNTQEISIDSTQCSDIDASAHTKIETSLWLDGTPIDYDKVQEASQNLAQITDTVVSVEDLPLDSFFLPSPPSSFSGSFSNSFPLSFPDSSTDSFTFLASEDHSLPRRKKTENGTRVHHRKRCIAPTSPPIISCSYNNKKNDKRLRPVQVKAQHKKRSKTRSSSNSSPIGGAGFVNFTPDDSHKILCGVAPSGSSKTKLRRDREAKEQRQRFQLLTVRAAREGRLERLLGQIEV